PRRLELALELADARVLLIELALHQLLALLEALEARVDGIARGFLGARGRGRERDADQCDGTDTPDRHAETSGLEPARLGRARRERGIGLWADAASRGGRVAAPCAMPRY